MWIRVPSYLHQLAPLLAPLSMNADSYCRLCALPRSELLQIFDGEGCKQNIIDSINKCLRIEVCPEDSLPTAVCLECNDKLEFTDKFIDASFEAQETLQNILEKSNLLKMENTLVLDDECTSNKQLVSVDDVDSSFFDNYVEYQNYINTDCDGTQEDDEDPSKMLISKSLEPFDTNDYLTIASDVNLRKKMEQKLREKEMSLKQLEMLDEETRKKQEMNRLKKMERSKLRKGKKGSAVNINKENSISGTPRNEISGEMNGQSESEGNESKVGIPDLLWPCPECDEAFPDVDEFKTHYKNTHGGRINYICPRCAKQYPKFSNIVRHLKKHDVIVENKQLKISTAKFSCTYCFDEFSSQILLETHLLTHPDAQQYVCGECGKKFRHQKALSLHANCHLPEDEKYKYPCDLCDKKYSSKPNLILHRRIHAGIRDFTCDQCGKSFIQKCNLDAHILTHSSYKPFACPICNKGFKTILQLKNHDSVHTGEKPHQCADCGKTFRQKSTLREHIRVHSGDLPFACEFCGKRFRFKGILTTHRRQHTGERPYSCEECQHHFTNWPNYNKHMKRRHGVNKSKAKRMELDTTESISNPPPDASVNDLSEPSENNETESLDFHLDVCSDQDSYDQPLPSINNLNSSDSNILSCSSSYYNEVSSKGKDDGRTGACMNNFSTTPNLVTSASLSSAISESADASACRQNEISPVHTEQK